MALGGGSNASIPYAKGPGIGMTIQGVTQFSVLLCHLWVKPRPFLGRMLQNRPQVRDNRWSIWEVPRVWAAPFALGWVSHESRAAVQSDDTFVKEAS